MSNSITPQVVAQVEAVLADKKKNRYSTSGIYAAHNAVFNKNEAPQSCASCLKKRAEALEKWYNALELTAVVNVGENPKGARPAPYIETFMIIDGERFTVVDDETEQPTTVNFTPASEGANHGIATDVKGKPAPAYLYEQEGKAYLVTGEEGAYEDVTEKLKTLYDEAQDFDLMDVTNKKGEAFKIKFVTVEGDTGTVTQADGKALNAGTYTTKDGDTLAVQPGGKATLKSNLL